MTITEYSYTESDIYRAIVQTAVPIALTADEVNLLVADLITLAAAMPHDDPAGVFHALLYNRAQYKYPEAWRGYVDGLTIKARRTASLDRISQQYPSLKGTV